jgi:hypothetical protein
MTLGMLFKLPQVFDLNEQFEAAELDACDIPGYARTGWSPHSVLIMRKSDFKLGTATRRPVGLAVHGADRLRALQLRQS